MTLQPQQNPNELLSITREELERCCSQMSAAGYKVSANYVEASVLSRSRQHPVRMGEISKICKLCNYETDCKEHDATTAAQAREDAMVEIVEELHRQFIGRTKSQILDIMCVCQINPEKWLKSLRTGGDE